MFLWTLWRVYFWVNGCGFSNGLFSVRLVFTADKLLSIRYIEILKNARGLLNFLQFVRHLSCHGPCTHWLQTKWLGIGILVIQSNLVRNKLFYCTYLDTVTSQDLIQQLSVNADIHLFIYCMLCLSTVGFSHQSYIYNADKALSVKHGLNDKKKRICWWWFIKKKDDYVFSNINYNKS